MKYTADWESIDSRPVPAWFEDAKFGIFIHWGLYSVPGYAPIGKYAEWYGSAMNNADSPERKFHLEHYGENFKYTDFVKDFKAELFDADEWAKLFERAGAKYINLVSKHHDGFCMYKSDFAWNWNSYDVGPHRDFCAELSEALSKTDVKFGVYHSVYEWYHPLYLESPEKYAVEHLIPMLKELVEKYKPYTLFTDGEWEHTSDVWHSTEFLSWLYNESSVKDYIVPNDRWGKETRGHHGGNFTTEYGIIDGNTEFEDSFNLPRACEECRGIGGSFGINRIENAEDYLGTGELIFLLTDLISRGCNLLLNIGPAADGTIPPLMQERLLDIGKWLKVNGEGVYSSRRYKKSTQENVCYTQRAGKVYAFYHVFPFGEITLEDIPYAENATVRLLGSDAKITPVNKNGKLGLSFAPLNPDEVQSKYVYVFEISGI